MNSKLSSLTLCSLLALAACDGLAGSGYNGEVLASVRGNVSNEMVDQTPSAQAILVWGNVVASPDVDTGMPVEVTGSFPAQFRLDVFLPPADIALNDFTLGGTRPTESRIGVAGIWALRGDLDVAPDLSNVQEPDVYGTAEDYVVVYIESDVQPGTLSESFVGGTLSAGFHLMDVYHMTDAELAVIAECQTLAQTDEEWQACGSGFDTLTEAPAGFDTLVLVRMVDDLDTLNVPNWS